MILVIDAGNTNIVLGVYESRDKLRMCSRISMDRAKTSDQFAVEIRDILRLYDISEQEITGAILSCVVPQVSIALKNAVRKILDCEVLTVGPGMKTGMQIRVDNPNEVGADIIVGCVAALDKYPVPCVVIDMGTVTKMVVLDRDRAMIGAVFMPGVRISAESLSEKTAQLPHVALDAPPKVVGTGTSACIRSGIIYGHASMIDGLADRIEEQVGEKCTFVVTGGHAASVFPHCRRKMIYDNQLLLDGLYLLYCKNAKDMTDRKA